MSKSGPLRVLPGRLSVSRTFGDIEAKLEAHGGVPGVVIAEPEIRTLRVTSGMDFIMLGCDGIFDKLTNKHVVAKVWESIGDASVHEELSKAVDRVLYEAIRK